MVVLVAPQLEHSLQISQIALETESDMEIACCSRLSVDPEAAEPLALRVAVVVAVVVRS
jgi:hypothetical protein